jgi:hypothetical protein
MLTFFHGFGLTSSISHAATNGHPDVGGAISKRLT